MPHVREIGRPLYLVLEPLRPSVYSAQRDGLAIRAPRTETNFELSDCVWRAGRELSARRADAPENFPNPEAEAARRRVAQALRKRLSIAGKQREIGQGGPTSLYLPAMLGYS